MSYNYALRPGTTQMLTPAGASTASSSFSSQTEYVRVASDSDVHIVFGASPTATANDIFLPANEIELFKVSPGEKVAVIGTANVSVVEMSS
jgi:hypothetical protein